MRLHEPTPILGINREGDIHLVVITYFTQMNYKAAGCNIQANALGQLEVKEGNDLVLNNTSTSLDLKLYVTLDDRLLEDYPGSQCVMPVKHYVNLGKVEYFGNLIGEDAQGEPTLIGNINVEVIVQKESTEESQEENNTRPIGSSAVRTVSAGTHSKPKPKPITN